MKPAVTESVLDGVIERLLLADRNVALALLEAAGLDADFDRVTIARQVRHVGTSGTADLVVRYWRRSVCAAMLLVENKIDAGFTPDQPDRYAISRDAQRASVPVVATVLLLPLPISPAPSSLPGSMPLCPTSACYRWRPVRTAS